MFPHYVGWTDATIVVIRCVTINDLVGEFAKAALPMVHFIYHPNIKLISPTASMIVRPLLATLTEDMVISRWEESIDSPGWWLVSALLHDAAIVGYANGAFLKKL